MTKLRDKLRKAVREALGRGDPISKVSLEGSYASLKALLDVIPEMEKHDEVEVEIINLVAESLITTMLYLVDGGQYDDIYHTFMVMSTVMKAWGEGKISSGDLIKKYQESINRLEGGNYTSKEDIQQIKGLL